MQTIYKYEIPNKSNFKIDLPINAEILTLQMQHGVPFIWAIVCKEAVQEPRLFELYQTGDTIPDLTKRKYIGTFQMFHGNLFYHLFEVIEM